MQGAEYEYDLFLVVHIAHKKRPLKTERSSKIQTEYDSAQSNIACNRQYENSPFIKRKWKPYFVIKILHHHSTPNITLVLLRQYYNLKRCLKSRGIAFY